MDNMDIWGRLRNTPQEAQKTISGGRLNGFTDINPMWRFRVLTETFGPCGIGWKYDITSTEIYPGADGEVMAILGINLYYMDNDIGQWSEPVPGIGGSMMIEKEKSGLHNNDECFKMALSDAIGTACKALGMSEDIYMSGKGGGSKYNRQQEEVKMETPEDAAAYVITFGKNKGKTLGELTTTREGCDYLTWLDSNEKTDPVIKKAIGILRRAAFGR